MISSMFTAYNHTDGASEAFFVRGWLKKDLITSIDRTFYGKYHGSVLQ